MGSVVEDLRRVAAGLRLVLLGLLALVVLAVVSVGVAATLAEPAKDPAAIVLALNRDHPGVMTLLLGLNVLASVLGIAGKALCTAIPAAAGATAFIVMALICDGFSLALSVVGQAANLGEAGRELVQAAPLFKLFGFFAFLRFLRRLAEYLGAPWLAERARRTLVGSASLFFATFLAAVAISSGGSQAIVVMVGLLLLVGVPALFFLYARLVLDLRRLTDAAADSVTEAD
jgi:hypothetical protein